MILVHCCVLCKEYLCLFQILIWIVSMHMPVYQRIHSELGCIIDTILNQCIKLLFGTVSTRQISNRSNVAWITDQSNHIDSPIITQCLERILIDILRKPMHTMGTGSTKLCRHTILIHHDRCRIAVNLLY